jgi:hypothetical protein
MSQALHAPELKCIIHGDFTRAQLTTLSKTIFDYLISFNNSLKNMFKWFKIISQKFTDTG